MRTHTGQRTTDETCRDMDDRSCAQAALLKEIERIVDSAKSSGRILRAGRYAGLLSDRYPEFSIGRIVDELVAAAAVAKVPVEISRPSWPDPDPDEFLDS
jgi:hypothetical protein